MKTYRQFFLVSLNIFLLFSLSVCGGGGGGDSSGSGSSPPPSVDVTGDWGGKYNLGYTYPLTIALKLQQNSGNLSGTFAAEAITETIIEGTINGSVTGNKIIFTMRDNSSCNNSFSGDGIVQNDSIRFNVDGKDCGVQVGGGGSISKLEKTGNIGWSGNWWNGDWSSGTEFVTLSTLDGVQYTGKVKFITDHWTNIVTADLTGQYGWEQKSGTYCWSIGEYNWMIMNLSNIQGQLYPNPVFVSGEAKFHAYNNLPGAELIQISWCFPGHGHGGAWYRKIK